jgi:hypothetical protein
MSKSQIKRVDDGYEVFGRLFKTMSDARAYRQVVETVRQAERPRDVVFQNVYESDEVGDDSGPTGKYPDPSGSSGSPMTYFRLRHKFYVACAAGFLVLPLFILSSVKINPSPYARAVLIRAQTTQYAALSTQYERSRRARLGPRASDLAAVLSGLSPS